MHLRTLLKETGEKLNDFEWADVGRMLESYADDSEFMKLAKLGIDFKIECLSRGRAIREPDMNETAYLLREAERRLTGDYRRNTRELVSEFLTERMQSGLATPKFESAVALEKWFVEKAQEIRTRNNFAPDRVNSCNSLNATAREAMQFLLAGFGSGPGEVVSALEPRMTFDAMLLMAEHAKGEEQRRSLISEALHWFKETLEF